MSVYPIYGRYYGYMPTGGRHLQSRFYRGYEFVNDEPQDGKTYKTPIDWPYSFDDYWVWHKDLSDKDNWGADYADRFIGMPGYYERWKEIVETIQAERKASKSFTEFFTFEDCQRIVEAVYEGKYDAMGLSLSANVSTGYKILVFWYKDKALK